jgi:hypothetical protein
MNTRMIAGLTAALALTITVGGSVPAMAKAGDVVRTGSCTGVANWKLKAGADNGRIQVEDEIDSNRNGQTWQWKIRHNGVDGAHGQAVTHAPSGSFTVRRFIPNAAGTDTIVFRAVRPATGQVCRGVVHF